jgi:DNA-3-methyladenine glycosylase
VGAGCTLVGVIDLSGPLLEVAPRLLGCVVVQDGVAVRLTEVEAYAGAQDAAAHAFIGPRPRTRALFGPPGTLYCYLSYGIHICGNLVCGGGSAILLRAGEVVGGLELARVRRPGVAVAALARGPGNLGRVLGWSLAASGRRLGEDGLELVAGEPAARWESGPRVGVSVAHGRPWRFWLPDSPSVSAYRRSPRIRDADDH